MNSAIIVAGGVGSRTISKVPKQFVRINTNNRILSFSVQAFKKNKNIDEVVIVVHKDWLDIINREFLNCKVVEGGKTRYDSSYQGLISCSSNCKNVLIHDAARPFISQIIIDTGFSSIDEFDAGIPIIDNRDSLLRLKENDIKYVDRKNIKVIQTPQFFNYSIIKEAYDSSTFSNKFTDDMSVLLNYNKDVKKIFFKGSIQNIKITTQDDLENAIKMLK